MIDKLEVYALTGNLTACVLMPYEFQTYVILSLWLSCHLALWGEYKTRVSENGGTEGYIWI
jgi:hypothetical protein